MLQLKDFRASQREEFDIRINIRKLNGVPSTKYLPYVLH